LKRFQKVAILNTFDNNFNNVVSVAGKLKLEEELSLISNLDLMLSMDSGNAHLAAMLGIKVITIWGVTHPYTGFAPFNQPFDNALVADRETYPLIPTSVYGNNFPEGYENAAGSIAVSEIVSKVKSVIKV
jgi:ADP-heptose:LPS heptosyltransferase